MDSETEYILREVYKDPIQSPLIGNVTLFSMLGTMMTRVAETRG